MIRVLIVDDSATARVLLRKLLESSPAIKVVGVASDGNEAVALAETLKPDLITMDVRMPNMDGLRATEQIMSRSPTPIVIVSSSVDAPDLQITFAALRAGALDVIEKPKSVDADSFDKIRNRLVDAVIAMSEIRVVRRRAPIGGLPAVEGDPKIRHLIAVGASTGGPQLLEQIFQSLPPDFSAPILLVQHMAPGFTAGFVRWLGQGCRVKVKLAEDREPLLPGVVYVAPDGLHLRISDRFTALTGPEPRSLFRPSIDALFNSIAHSSGPASVGVLLTGMGSDGAQGLRAMRLAGSLTLAQDSASCIVAGMPDSARALEAVERTIVPEALPALLLSLVSPREG